MTPIRRISVAAALATAGLVLTIPAAAQADPSSGADYGQHVRACAQTMGNTGSHNPGMHQGNAGWNGMTCDT